MWYPTMVDAPTPLNDIIKLSVITYGAIPEGAQFSEHCKNHVQLAWKENRMSPFWGNHNGRTVNVRSKIVTKDVQR